MSFTGFQAGTRIEAVRDFGVEEAPARRDKTVHRIQAGDSGEVLRKLALGNNNPVIIRRWDKIPRTRLSVGGALFEGVNVVG